MRNPENTSKRDPLHHLVGLMGGSDAYIEGMEAAGQRQLVHSDRLPTAANPGDDAYLAAGFTFGPVDAGDPLFRPATLPDGWTKQGSDHDMWSYVVDELGRRRVAVFYKAAFYDRRAFMRLESVSGYAYRLLEDGGQPVFDQTWCTPKALYDALGDLRHEKVDRERLYASKLDDPRVSWAAEELVNVQRELEKLDKLAASVLAAGHGRGDTRPKPVETHAFEPAYRATAAERVPVDACGRVTFEGDVGGFCTLPADHPVHLVTAPYAPAVEPIEAPGMSALTDEEFAALQGGDV